MPKILEQPRWSFWKFREVYQIDVMGDAESVREQATAFFRNTPAVDFITEPDGFGFRRSSGWRGLFSVSERKMRHEV